MLPVQPFKGKYQRPDLRNHRKILVVDGEVAFMGSQNIIDRSYNKRGNIKRGLKWKELVARLEGPIVSGLDAIFSSDWYLETGEVIVTEIPAFDQPGEAQNLDCQVVPSGPGFRNENNLKLFLSLLYAARERIIITSPYFVPDESMLYAISGATQRGVHVEPVRLGDRRPGARLPRAAVVLRSAAAHRGEDLAVPGALHPALEALLDRRRRRGDRVEQHGHPVVRAERRDLAARARRVVRARHARGRGGLSQHQPRAHARRVVGAAAAVSVTTWVGAAVASGVGLAVLQAVNKIAANTTSDKTQSFRMLCPFPYK